MANNREIVAKFMAFGDRFFKELDLDTSTSENKKHL